MIQNIDRHPLEEARKPPATGPSTGPSSVPEVNIAIANPRLSCLTISAIMPPPLVNGTAANMPCISLITINIPKLVDKAHAMLKTMNPIHPTCWTDVRP